MIIRAIGSSITLTEPRPRSRCIIRRSLWFGMIAASLLMRRVVCF